MNMADAVLGPALARGQADDAAIICQGETVSYGQLSERVNRAGNGFAAAGIGRGERVLLLISDRPEFFYVYLGLIKIGAIPVALNMRLAPADIAYTIEDSGCAGMVLETQFSGLFEDAVRDLAVQPAVFSVDAKIGGYRHLPSMMAAAPGELASVLSAPDDPCFWMYSSGTTGKPKGVVHNQCAADGAEYMFGELMGVQPGDRIFASSKLFFAFSLAHSFLATLRLGATAILYPDWPDAAAVGDIAETYRPTIVLSVPTFFRNMLRDGVAEGAALKEVRYFISAGEKLPRSLFDAWMEATGRPILEGIGATETCFLFLANRPDQMCPGTCGVPTPGTEVRILDQDGKLVTEPGTAGVLWVQMVSIARGYRNLEERTEAVFKDGWYCTNDMFSVDEDGWYEYQGRADDMLKISGQWVSPVEIEEHVLANPKVSEAAVVGVPNQDGLIRLALFMVAPDVGDDAAAFEKELQDDLVKNLSIYKCPRRMFYLDEMPLTATGKLQRVELRQIVIRSGEAAE
ncbi:MAG: benzoate-CoA ligase family protein [Rhodospirillales bacterium]|jgi:benzoate-CoA ligase|nr:benzoate-CoA ligase family protein [Rhodospirillales bacterium]